MSTETFIQATIAVGVYLLGTATGVALQREVVSAAETGRTQNRFLTPTRVMAIGVVLISIFGILTAVSVRGCQSRYNEAFGNSSAQSRAGIDIVINSLVTLTDGLGNPDPAARVKAFNDFHTQLAEAKRLRAQSPLPPPPEC